LILGAIVVLSALFRLLLLQEKSLWHDEAFSAWVARLDWPDFIKVLSEDVNMSLYYLLLRVWLGLGESEFVLRSLSVIFAVATVPVLYALATDLFGRSVGMIGALLLAVNAYHIHYSQEARAYSLVVFLVTTSSLFFIRGIKQPARLHWAGYILATVFGIYTHLFAALVVIAHCISLVFLPRRQVPWKRLVWSMAITGLLILPLIVLIVTGDAQQLSWIPEAGLFTVLRVFSALSGAGGPALLAAYFICCLIALLEARKAWSFSGSASLLWHYGFLLTGLFTPVLLALTISALTQVFSLRYFIICVPFMTLLAAAGISRVHHRWLFVGIMVTIVSLAIRGISVDYSSPKEDWRAVAEYVVSESRSGDTILLYPASGRIPFDYYRDHLNGWHEWPPVVFPSQHNYARFFRELRHAAPDEPLLDNLPAEYKRVWLILGSKWEHAAIADAIRKSLSSSYQQIEKTEFADITVVLYTTHI
jgi:uncharacterized membrane protein